VDGTKYNIYARPILDQRAWPGILNRPDWMLFRNPVKKGSSNNRCYALSVRDMELVTQLYSQNVYMIIIFSDLASQGSALANAVLPVLLLRHQACQTAILATLLTDEAAVSCNYRKRRRRLNFGEKEGR